jgi:hypothetical protein
MALLDLPPNVVERPADPDVPVLEPLLDPETTFAVEPNEFGRTLVRSSICSRSWVGAAVSSRFCSMLEFRTFGTCDDGAPPLVIKSGPGGFALSAAC